MNPHNIEIEPHIEAAVHEVIGHLINALSLQGMTLAELTIHDAEEVGTEVFHAYVAHGALDTSDFRQFSLCYRQSLLMSTATTNEFANDWA